MKPGGVLIVIEGDGTLKSENTIIPAVPATDERPDESWLARIVHGEYKGHFFGQFPV